VIKRRIPGNVARVAAQVASDFVTGGGVERGERFVEQKDRRLGGEGAGQRDSLRLPAGQLTRSSLLAAVEPDALQPERGVTTRVAAARPSGSQPVGDVVDRAQMREQQVVLEHDADGPSFGRQVHALVGVVEHRAIELDAP